MSPKDEEQYKDEALGVAQLLELTVPDTEAYIIAYVRDEQDQEGYGSASILLNGNPGALYPLAEEVRSKIRQTTLENTPLSDMEHPLDALGDLSLSDYLKMLEQDLKDNLNNPEEDIE